MEKSIRKIFLAMLCCCMIFSSFMIITSSKKAFAKASDNINYVSLGDSYIAGYGLSDFTNNGYKAVVNGAFPTKFSKYLEEINKKEVNLSQLAMRNMRVTDLLYLLEFDPHNSEMLSLATESFDVTTENGVDLFNQRWNSTFKYGDYFTWKNFTFDNLSNIGIESKAKNLQNVVINYQDSVKKADIITLSIGNEEFNTFLLENVVNSLGLLKSNDFNLELFNLDNAVREVDPRVQQLYLEILDSVVEIVNDVVQNEELVTNLSTVVGYIIASYIYNYDNLLNRILELNPNAEIVILGLLNTFNDISIQTDETEDSIISLGELQKVVIKYINFYLSTIPSVNILSEVNVYSQAKIYFSELENYEPLYSHFTKNYNSTTKQWVDVNNVKGVELRKLIIDSFNSTIIPVFVDAVNPTLAQYGFNLVNFEYKHILAYEEYIKKLNNRPSEKYEFEIDENKDGIKEKVTLSYNQRLTIALYLSIEESILSGASIDVISLKELEKLANGLDGIIASIMDKMNFEELVDMDDLKSRLSIAIKGNIISAGTEIVKAFGFDIINKISDPNFDIMILIDWLVNDSVICKGIYLQEVSVFLCEKVTPTLSEALKSEESILMILGMYAKLLIGDGFSLHPTINGYNNILNSVKAAYENEVTPINVFARNVNEISGFINNTFNEETNGNSPTFYHFIDMVFNKMTDMSNEDLREYLINNMHTVNSAMSSSGFGTLDEAMIMGFIDDIVGVLKDSLSDEFLIHPQIDKFLVFGNKNSFEKYLSTMLKIPNKSITYVDVNNLSVEDLLYILNQDANVSSYVKSKNEKKLRYSESYKNKIKYSNLISLNFNANSFNSYIDYQLNSKKSSNVEWSVISNKTNSLLFKVLVEESLIDLEKQGASSSELNYFRKAIEGYLFSFLSYYESYINLIKEIKTINPNAQIIVSGLKGTSAKNITKGKYFLNLNTIGIKAVTYTNFSLVLDISSIDNVIFANNLTQESSTVLADKVSTSITPTVCEELTIVSKDEHSHGFTCTCHEGGELPHELKWVTLREPYKKICGLKQQECTVCDYTTNLTEFYYKKPINAVKGVIIGLSIMIAVGAVTSLAVVFVRKKKNK